MHVWVYKGDRKTDTYLYLTAHNRFDRVPEALLSLLGNLSLVVDFDILARKRLAQADIETAVSQLREKGYFLQLPPDRPADLLPC